MDHDRKGRLGFGTYELDLDAGELRRGGAPVDLTGQPLALLELLARNAGRLVEREEIRRHLWGEQVHVDFDQGINAAVRQVRQALRDDAANPRFVATVPRRGYRFVAPVEARAPLADGPVPGTTARGPEGSRPTPSAPLPEGSPPTAPAVPLRSRPLLRLAVLLAVLVGVASGLTAWVGSQDPEPTAEPAEGGPPPRLAVLPFAGPRDGGGWLAGGFTEELVLELSRRHRGQLDVLAATSSRRLDGVDDPLRLAMAELGADFAVRGTVQQEGGDVRVNVHLLRTRDRVLLWAGSYDRPLQDVLEVQREVGEKVARALSLTLTPTGGGGHRRSPAPDPEAYRAYLEGREQLETGNAEAAVADLERAVELDPGLAPAWTGLARALRHVQPPLAGRDRVVEALERALALDDSQAPAHLELGLVRMYVDLDPVAAERHLRRALELTPSLAEAHHAYAGLLSSQGRHGEALEHVRRALSLDPLSPMVGSDVGWFLYFAGRHREAEEATRETLEREPDFFWARRARVLIPLAAGDPERAAAAAEADLAAAPVPGPCREPLPTGVVDLGNGERADLDGIRRRVVAERGAGRPEAALDLYWRWHRGALLSPESCDPFPATLADLHAALGEEEAALDRLEEAFRQRTGWVFPYLSVYPLYDPLRDDPRFQDLLRRIADAGTPVSRPPSPGNGTAPGA